MPDALKACDPWFQASSALKSYILPGCFTCWQGQQVPVQSVLLHSARELEAPVSFIVWPFSKLFNRALFFFRSQAPIK